MSGWKRGRAAPRPKEKQFTRAVIFFVKRFDKTPRVSSHFQYELVYYTEQNAGISKHVRSLAAVRMIPNVFAHDLVSRIPI